MKQRIIQSIIEITRARDTDSLESCLLVSLSDLLPLDRVALISLVDELKVKKSELSLALTIHGDTTNPSDAGSGTKNDSHQWDHQPRHVDVPEELLPELSSNRSALIRRDGQITLYVPVMEDGRLIKLIQLESINEALAEQRAVVEGIAEIYSNFLKVLEDSQRDKLTGLLNRRTFDKKLLRMMELQRKVVNEYGEGEHDRRQPAATEFAWLAIIDIDHFKKVNDQHGHIYGDEVILTVGQTMQKFFRNTDLLFRFGGEEFIVVLEPMAVERARATLDRFRDSVATHLFKQIGGISVSIGFARLEERD